MSCIAQNDETSCKTLRFKGNQRCNYQKKWLSIFRGGTCIIDENVVQNIVSNLRTIIKIKWDVMKAFPIKNSPLELPNPDQFTKEDIIDLIHDLGHHMKEFFGGKDLIFAIEEINGKPILDLEKQHLLYYLYLFSYIIYASGFLTLTDFEQIFRDDVFLTLNKFLSEKNYGKNALVNFIVGFNSLIPQKSQRTKNERGWDYSALIGPILLSLLFSFLPTGDAFIQARLYQPGSRWPRGEEPRPEKPFTEVGPILALGLAAITAAIYAAAKIQNYLKTPEQLAEEEKMRRRAKREEKWEEERERKAIEREEREIERTERRHERAERAEQLRRSRK